MVDAYVRYYSESDALPTEAFRYQELDPSIPSTRLILLLSANNTLDSTERRRLIPRIKLSYAWETSTRDQVIELSGKALKVSHVVEDLLLRLRDEKEDRLLWIDQMCINQDDDREKASQVGRMKDIFGQARQVIVSLGPHDGTVSGCFWGKPMPWYYGEKLLESGLRLAQRTSKQRALNMIRTKRDFRLIRRSMSPKEINQLASLMKAPIFDRVWVVQEIAAAQSLLVICGDTEVEGEAFKSLYSRILPHLKDADLKARLEQLRPLIEYMWKEEHRPRSKPELLILLNKFSQWKATVPHDKIYALLGLSLDGTALTPDYKLRIDEVFLQVTSHLMDRHRHLDILTYARGCPGTECFESPPPSWCPDWGSTWMATTLNSRSLAFRSVIYAGRCDFTYRRIGRVLEVQGIALATIQAVLDSGIDVSIASQLRGTIADMATTCSSLSDDLQKVSVQLTKSGRSLRKRDHIFWVFGRTGVVILRPMADMPYYRFVFSDCGQFLAFDTPNVFPNKDSLFGIDLSLGIQLASPVQIC